MNEPIVTRRNTVEAKIEHPLPFQLVMLLRSRKEIKYVCTKSSLALRATILCELALENMIVLDNGIVKTAKGASWGLFQEFTNMIAEESLSPQDLLLYANGDKRNSKGIKNLRKKVYLQMAQKGYITLNKGKIFSKIELKNIELSNKIQERIVYETRSNNISNQTKAILIALDYINEMESFLLQCDEPTREKVVENVDSVKNMIKRKEYSKKDALFYQFLGALLKL